MQASARLGFGIAALIAAGVLAVSVFGDKHENWFLRTAQERAARCMTQGPCTTLGRDGSVVLGVPAPLNSDGPCAKPRAWKELAGVSNGQTNIVLTCTEGATYLYHFGTLKGRDAGGEQWLRCATADCGTERNRFQQS